MTRAMALDLGDARIGIALSDPLKIIANGYETYNRVSEQADLDHIVGLIAPNDVDTVVIGLPINMDGTHGERVVKTKTFGNKLAELCKAKIVYQDERMTTMTAQRVLLEADMRRDKRKKVIDKIAATIILQTYLDMPR